MKRIKEFLVDVIFMYVDIFTEVIGKLLIGSTITAAIATVLISATAKDELFSGVLTFFGIPTVIFIVAFISCMILGLILIIVTPIIFGVLESVTGLFRK